MIVNRIRYSAVIIALLVIIITFFFNAGAFAAEADNRPLRYNQETVKALDLEITQNPHNARYLSVLKGLRWCVIFFDDDTNFDSAFYNYFIMLDELSQRNPGSTFAQIVHALILKEFDRALPKMSLLITADEDGFESFIALLPVIYHHNVPIQPFRKFDGAYFSGVDYPDHLKEFRRAAKKLDYGRLSNIVSNAACLDMAYRWKAEKDFRLPPNRYDIILKESLDIPLLARYNDDTYEDQNYFATHLIFAMNHYGQRPYRPSALGDKIFFYLIGQYKTVRDLSGNFDILCEYLYCLRQFGLRNAEFIDEEEKHIISLQRPDGSWGAVDDPDDRPYHLMHPTWTAITLLVQGM